MRHGWWVAFAVLMGCGQMSGARPDAPGWWVPTGDVPTCGDTPSCASGVPGCLRSDGTTHDDIECIPDHFSGVVEPNCLGGEPACLRPLE